MRTLQHFIPNRDGWHLSLHQSWSEERLLKNSHPVLIVPGYGMNSFIFGYHPGGTSLESALVEAGLEVWRVDLRGQGESRSVGGTDTYSMADLAVTDLGAAIDAALERSQTGASRVAVIGASLGGSLMFGHAAVVKDHKIGLFVSVGAPIRWVKVNALLRIAFSSPTLAGLVRFKGTRQLAGTMLPHVLRHTPWLLSIYMNPQHVDQTALAELVRTVEDPNRHINREIAQWIRSGDLVLANVNVANNLSRIKEPLLCIVAHADGIVPPETASFSYKQVASSDKQLLLVGDDQLRLAHADMFVSNHAHDKVFAPIRDFVVSRPAQG